MTKDNISNKANTYKNLTPQEQNNGLSAHEHLSERVYNQLKEDILCCQLPPGDHINESSLAKRYGVSRTPVREALRRIMQEGYVEVLPRRGYKITPITINDIQEIFTLRIILEGEAIALATPIISEEVLHTLDGFLEEMASKDISQSMDSYRMAYIDANYQFHNAIAKASSNKRLSRMVTSLLEEAARFIYLETNAVGVSGIDESQRIIGAMRIKDAQLARQLMRDHIQATYDRVVNVIISDMPDIVLD
jgi:DNA-binding GntR family transcriptional regulator